MGGEASLRLCRTSLADLAELPGVALLPPATRGAVAAALKAGYTRIGIVDGAIKGGSRLTLRGVHASAALQYRRLSLPLINIETRLFQRSGLSTRSDIDSMFGY